MERAERRETETEENASVERKDMVRKEGGGGGDLDGGGGRRRLYCDVPERDRRNERRVLAWMVPWMASWWVADELIERGWLTGGAPTVFATLLTTAFGIATFVTYRRYLRQADELHRKIHLEALAVAFGVGLLGGMAYLLLEQAGAVGGPGLLVLLVAMFLTLGLGILVGLRRYS